MANQEPHQIPPASDDADNGLAIRIDAEYASSVNYAVALHRVPLVDHLAITNTGPTALDDLAVELRLANGDGRIWTGAISRIEPGETYRLTPEGFGLDAARLATRTESERTTIEATVSGASGSASRGFEVDLLAFDQWGGLSPYPELLGAFVTPNHPAVAPLLARAREILERAGEDPSINGYQSGSRARAASIAEACFGALGAESLGYISPPASFERRGQRVRLIDRVLSERQGTCLDLALVLAGLWEQAGLNPVIVFFEDHAFPALWTHDEHFPEPVIDEVQRIRNHAKLGDLLPVESTRLTRDGVSFADAVRTALEKLHAERGEVVAVDIRTARRLGVRPLPLRVEPTGSVIDPDAHVRPLASAESIETISLAERAALREPVPAEPRTRVDRWKRKLLDLSLRNRLLNFRETRRSIPISVPDLAALEDVLASGTSFDILPRPDRRGSADDGFTDAFRREEMQSGRLFSTETEAETSRRLLEIYRASRSSIEETGANVLHLALGMLHWYETPTADQLRRAPLLLLPLRIVRRTGGGGYRYRIELTDEPIRPNITLIEKLRAEYGLQAPGLEELPEDENGVDTALVLHRFREAIRETSRWEVVESAHVGLFSFNKFLMWHDLQQHGERLRENPVVRHMVETPHEPYGDGPLPDPASLDRHAHELLCTRDADSSQLCAIAAAAAGRTFVLEGPPGTGKSQTIANIIANSLAHGKRVLFVAEKMAALSVVRRRLDKDGLGPFCLELHSARASKKEVLRELGQALEAASISTPEAWDRTSGELETERNRLNAYVDALHESRATGETIYGVIGRLASLGPGPSLTPEIDDPGLATGDQLQAWREALRNLRDAGEAVAPVHEHPLRGVGRADWSFSLPADAAPAIDAALQTLSTLRAEIADLAAQIAPGADPTDSLSHAEIDALRAAAEGLPHGPDVQPALLEASDPEALAKDLREWLGRDRAVRARRAALLERYRPELFEIDLLATLDAVKAAFAKPPIIRWLFTPGARRRIRPVTLEKPGPLPRIIADLEEALAVKREQEAIAEHAEWLRPFLGAQWGSDAFDHDAGELAIRWALTWNETLRPLHRSPAGQALAAGLTSLASDREARSREQHPAAEACRRIAEAGDAWSSALARLTEVLRPDPIVAWGGPLASGWMSRASEALQRWRESLTSLNDWCAWRAAREAAVAAGVASAAEALERGELRLDEVTHAFERGFGERWLVAAADASEPIRMFNPTAHDRTVERFADLDKERIRLTRLTVAARLAERIPGGGGSVAPTSEVGILRRELEKRSRHMPTRRLIESLPNLLPRLKPCFLMSPLSVAQYLDPGRPPFDIVVFDEASQIPVWDAIGAIARGTTVIVVGDSKQLPPTNFFNTLDGDEDETDLVVAGDDELESILQECNATGLPALRLRWHYRSRHESLITFSNHHYYDDELHTFPSPVERNDRLGVGFVLVEEGEYDRGNTRTNQAEASAVVKEVGRRLREDPGRSVGIVTFNINQQGLIEDMLDTLRREEPALEAFFTSPDEPLFVKNLENVQGDERDVIIFSVGYGPDRTGRVSMNFGPLNTDGGERRLNVAVTRARDQLVVFSSLPPDAIDLSRTRATGVRHFKTYLEYAQRGPGAIAQALERGRDTSRESGLEETIAARLRERGWTVDRRVGCGGYRIDLAVRRPDDPSAYLLGIECDGPTYADANTARDRDRTRGAVLRGLKWDLVRVWSTAWRLDPDGCMARIESALVQALAGKDKPTDAPAPARPEPPRPSDEQPRAGAPAAKNAPPSSDAGAVPYKLATRPRSATAAADIFAPRNTPRGTEALAAIVEQEGPIVPELALRRLADWFGVGRVTDRFRERFSEILGAAAAAGRIAARGDAFWPAGADPARYDTCRAPTDDEDTHRDIDWIPLAERAAAVRAVLRTQIALPREDLEREAARLLGVQRATARTREVMGEAIDVVVASGRAAAEGDRIALP